MFQNRLIVVNIHHGSLCLRSVYDSSSLRSEPCTPEERLIRPRIVEEVIDVVEVGEVGIYLDHPIRLRKYDSPDIEQADLSAEKWLVLYPRDHVVHAPRYVEKDRCDREIPAIDWRIRKDERIVGHA